jgi:hypothetical protein
MQKGLCEWMRQEDDCELHGSESNEDDLLVWWAGPKFGRSRFIVSMICDMKKEKTDRGCGVW